MTEEDRRPILDKDALLPINLIVAPLAFSFWMGSRLNALDSRLASIEQTLEEVGGRKVSIEDFRVWRADFARQNPSLDIPRMQQTGASQ